MKKYILTFFLIISLCSINSSFADECSQSCKIQDGPASAIEAYLKNMNKLLQNALKSAKGEKETSSMKKIQQEITAELSKVTDF